MTDDIKLVLRNNVLTLLQHADGPLPPGQSGVSRLKRSGIGHGTAQRVLDGQTSIGLDVVAQLANYFGVAPWQLLVPGLDPASLPGLTADPTAWPFELVDRAGYKDLTAVERAFVQGAMQSAIDARLALRAGKRMAA